MRRDATGRDATERDRRDGTDRLDGKGCTYGTEQVDATVQDRLDVTGRDWSGRNET